MAGLNVAELARTCSDRVVVFSSKNAVDCLRRIKSVAIGRVRWNDRLDESVQQSSQSTITRLSGTYCVPIRAA